MNWFTSRPQTPDRRRIRLGSYGSGLFPKLLEVDTDTLQVHAHLEGKSGYGKSRFFAALYLSWLASRQASAILIDPHRDLGDLLLARLIAEGFFHHPRALDRFIAPKLPSARGLSSTVCGSRAVDLRVGVAVVISLLSLARFRLIHGAGPLLMLRGAGVRPVWCLPSPVS